MQILENVYLVGSGKIGLSHPFDCHIYLIDGDGELALIDSGAGVDVELVLSNIEKDGFDPQRITRILLTHHHADHSGGSRKIKQATSARVCIHREGAPFVEDGDEKKMGLAVAKRSGLYSPGYTFPPCEVDSLIEDKEVISVGKSKLTAIHTPGHSKDSLCFYMEDDDCRALFSGDVVFFEGKIGLLNRSGSNLEDYRENFSKIASLSFDALLPGHNLFVLRGGMQHVETAALALQQLSPPPNFI